MGLVYRRRVKGPADTTVNVSGGGLSLSKRIGRRVTLNSRGGGSVRILPGLSFRFRWRK